MREALKTTELVIGRDSNKLSMDSNGNMIFEDTFVGPVKLSDFVGGEVVIDPAALILIEETDWVAQPADDDGRIFYRTTFNHDWGLENDNDTDELFPISVSVQTWNSNNELVIINKIWTDANNVYFESSRALELKASVKRIS
jgi:hypothetical protein